MGILSDRLTFLGISKAWDDEKTPLLVDTHKEKLYNELTKLKISTDEKDLIEECIDIIDIDHRYFYTARYLMILSLQGIKWL